MWGTIEIVLMFLLLIVPNLIYRQWWLAGTCLLFFICFVIVELLCIHFTGMSISQHFWVLLHDHKEKAYWIAGCMFIGFVFLIIHFVVR